MEYGELSRQMGYLFAEQVSEQAILTDDFFYQREAGMPGYQPGLESGQGSMAKTVVIGGFRFNLLYVRSRCLRHDQNMLFELGIKNPNAARYYEYCQPDSPYVWYISGETWQSLPSKIREQTKTAVFFNYSAANPKARSLPVNLRGKDGIQMRFNLTPNLTPACANHYVLWPEFEGLIGLNQTYNENTLYWIDDLFCQLDTDYSLFFSADGSGNSVNTFHLQVLKLPFPAFSYLDRYYESKEPVTMTSMRAWPLPGILARYGSGAKDEALAEFDRNIRGWLSLDDSHTFNLLFRIKTAGIREAFFIFRKKGFTRLSGIKNEFGGCEAGGNIIIEDRQDYDNFPGETDRLELVSVAG